MDNSNSSEESSSSDYTTDSSEDDGMETAQINGIKVQLPQGLCERQDIFREFFSAELWNSLSEMNKQHLQTFLPNFPENDDYEKSKTLERLFDCDTFRFNSPLLKFHNDLKAGYFRPDIVHMRKIIQKAERKEAKYRYRTYKEQLKHDVIESQRLLLNQIRNLPPGVEPKQEKRKFNVDYVAHRTKRRYFHILSTIRAKTEDAACSSDENYPEGAPVSLSRKQKRHLNSIKNGLTATKEKFFGSTMAPKLNGTGIDLEKYVTPNHNPFYVNDETYKNLIYQHKKRKLETPDDPELTTKGITVTDIVNRTQLPYIKNLQVSPSKHNNTVVHHRKKIKREPILNNNSEQALFSGNKSNNNSFSANSDSDSDTLIDAAILNKHKLINRPPPVKMKTVRAPTPKIKVEIKQEIKKEIVEVVEIPAIIPTTPTSLIQPINNCFSQYGKITPVKVEDLDGIDMMNIPIDLDNSNIDFVELTNKPELMQETHANFFSLVRDVICSTNEHRMNMYTLQERLKAWQENPISPLNDWYSKTDNWISLLPSAITFLCGNSSEQPDDFVPYMEYKGNVDMYQWIGAGRDSDSLLSSLCNFWLEHRTESKHFTSPIKEKDEMDVDISDRTHTPPPPRFPTNWTVRRATLDEVKDFREQERRRYDNPHKAFTYRCNGYESVVGPLKGIYNAAVGNTKARGHTMLNADRPNFVTILSLVRDATARLPNGEGTRAEICELLKASQYISSTALDNILQSVVSGALDRMHTQFDPCVKYDPKRKIWIYLHRNRTEEDFERIHQQYQGVNKAKKTTTKKSPAKAKPKPSEKVKPVKEVEVKAPPSPRIMQTKAEPPTLIPVMPQKATTSLLLSNNKPPEVMLESTKSLIKSPEEKELSQALQTIRVSSPTTIKGGKSLMKILPPSGKSLILPTGNSQLLKQLQEQRNTPTKQISQVVTQQLLQTIAAQQKQLIVQKESVSAGDKIKVPVSIQQQIIQSFTPQQLQSIKNVTLMRAQNQQLSADQQTNVVTVAVSKQPSSADDPMGQPSLQIKTHGNLTPAQQQQILQTIKQKILPQTNVLQSQQQQIILKQKVSGHNKHNMSPSGGTSILSPAKLAAGNSPGPMVAKVLTNAAGQVISVESLLAHQKQHGSLPQGTTLRVSGTKGGQQNIIHLTSSPKSNTITQFAVASQNNLITLTTQPKLVVASHTSTVTSTVTSPKPITRTLSKSPAVTKFSPKVTQQLINAKILTQNLDGQKLVQPKLVMSQSNMNPLKGAKSLPISKPVTLSMAGNAAGNTIRMVNAANLNLTHIGGKPVLLASKGGTIQNLQGQNVILQAQPNASGTSLMLQNAVKNTAASSSSNNLNIINSQNIVFAPQVKVQQPQVVFSSTPGKNSGQVQGQQSHLVLGGHPVRLQTSTSSSSGGTQRVVLASQGQGGQIVAQQILLPAGFQGTAINIKALQGVKVIPIAQAGQGKGIQGRQVYARVMNPSIVKPAQAANVIPEKIVNDNTIPSPD